MLNLIPYSIISNNCTLLFLLSQFVCFKYLSTNLNFFIFKVLYFLIQSFTNSPFYSPDQMSNKSMSQPKDQLNLDKAVKQLSKKFLLGHQKSQIKQKQGIVFIGNSRIGKSTISATISGLRMHLALDGKEFKIEPKQFIYRSNKNIIQHTLTSVTQFPNTYQANINGKSYTVVDLPGFKDTSYEKELCNWHYIKSILQQLDKILFVMVMQVNTDSKLLQDSELQMMQRFAQAFPCQQPHQPKRNLVTIINFMQNAENEKAQDLVKSEIKQNVEAQLQKLTLRQFYSKSFEHDRIFLMEKVNKKAASQKQIKQGSDYENPKLMEFIKKNTVLMEQTQHSTFKINLTKQMNEKSKNLRKILESMTLKIFKSIAQKFGVYKNLFTHLLTRMSETDGVLCDKRDYQDLDQYCRYNDLKEYKKIGLYFGSSSLENDSRKQQEIIHDIVYHFSIISNQETDFRKSVQKAREIFFKFLNLIEQLCNKLFKGDDLDHIEEIAKNMKKNIHIDCNNLAYIYESVQNFPIESGHLHDYDFQQYCSGQLYELYVKIKKVVDKTSLKNYFTKLFKSYEKLSAKKLDLKNLQKFKQSCQIMGFEPLKAQVIILIYKSYNRKLFAPEILAKPQTFYQIFDEMNKKELKKDQVEKIEAWKKTSPEWQFIKNQQSIQFLKILKSIKGKKYEAVEFYLKFDHSFEELMELLESIVKDTEQQGLNKKRSFDACMQSAQHLAMHNQLILADKCCKLAMKIYLFDDKDNVVRAKMKSIEIKNRMRVPINEAQAQQQLQRNPWVDISDRDYERILDLMMDSKDLIEENKKQVSEVQLLKLVSGQSIKSVQREKSGFLSGQESPSKSLIQSPVVRKQEQNKPRAIIKKSLKEQGHKGVRK